MTDGAAAGWLPSARRPRSGRGRGFVVGILVNCCCWSAISLLTAPSAPTPSRRDAFVLGQSGFDRPEEPAAPGAKPMPRASPNCASLARASSAPSGRCVLPSGERLSIDMALDRASVCIGHAGAASANHRRRLRRTGGSRLLPRQARALIDEGAGGDRLQLRDPAQHASITSAWAFGAFDRDGA